MDKSAPFRDMEVEDSYSDLNRAYSRAVKTADEKYVEMNLEEMKRAYL